MQISQREGRELTLGNWALVTFIVWMVVAVAAALLFVFAGTAGRRIGVAVMALYASAGVGALAGFIFAVPKFSDDERGSDGENFRSIRRAYRANSNLSQVSDWLTKIIVGVGLVEIRQLADGLGAVATRLGLTFGDQPGDPGAGAAFGLALVLASALVTFLTTYTWAATRFYQALVKQEGDAPPEPTSPPPD